jgi:hypothetical protein
LTLLLQCGMAASAAFMSNNGRDGTRKPVGRLMFNSDKIDAATGRPTRVTTAGEVCVPTRGKATFVTHSLAVWNACQELRSAVTKSTANRPTTVLAPAPPSKEPND